MNIHYLRAAFRPRRASLRQSKKKKSHVLSTNYHLKTGCRIKGPADSGLKTFRMFPL